MRVTVQRQQKIETANKVERWRHSMATFSLAITWLFMGRSRWNKFYSIAETRLYQKSFRFKVMRVTVQPQIKSKLRTKSKDGDTRGHVTWFLRPSISSDRIAPKTKSVEHIKAFRFMSIWFASSSKLSTFFSNLNWSKWRVWLRNRITFALEFFFSPERRIGMLTVKQRNVEPFGRCFSIFAPIRAANLSIGGRYSENIFLLFLSDADLKEK